MQNSIYPSGLAVAALLITSGCVSLPGDRSTVAATPIKLTAADETELHDAIERATDLLPAPRVIRRVEAVVPSGWRRTVHGWERAEQWLESSTAFAGGTADSQRPVTINDWIRHGRTQEAGCLATVFSGLRMTHPLVFAVGLIVTAVLISRIGRRGAALAGPRN